MAFFSFFQKNNKTNPIKFDKKIKRVINWNGVGITLSIWTNFKYTRVIVRQENV